MYREGSWNTAFLQTKTSENISLSNPATASRDTQCDLEEKWKNLVSVLIDIRDSGDVKNIAPFTAFVARLR